MSTGAARADAEPMLADVSPVPANPGDATGTFRLPDFSKERELFAIASRSAGRLNAASISQAEIAQLLEERQKLLDKKFAETITRQENNRLDYVRWSLDRIEDAQTGEMLDRLEGYLVQYENLLTNIQDLQRQLDSRLPKKK